MERSGHGGARRHGGAERALNDVLERHALHEHFEQRLLEVLALVAEALRRVALGVEIQSDDENQIVLGEEDVPDIPLDLGIHLERDEREDIDETGR